MGAGDREVVDKRIDMQRTCCRGAVARRIGGRRGDRGVVFALRQFGRAIGGRPAAIAARGHAHAVAAGQRVEQEPLGRRVRGVHFQQALHRRFVPAQIRRG